MEGAGQGGSSSQLLADLRPRSSATPLSLQGGARARPMAALQRWKEKQRWTRTDQAPRRFHEARQELPRTPRPKFPPCVVAVDCAGTAKTQFPRSRSCRRGAEMRIRRQFPSQLSQTCSKLSDAPDTSSLRRTGLPRRDVLVPRWVLAHESRSEPWRRWEQSVSKEAGSISHFPV